MGSLLSSETQPSLLPRLPAPRPWQDHAWCFPDPRTFLYHISSLPRKQASVDPQIILKAPTTNARRVDPKADRGGREESWPTGNPCAPVTLGFCRGCVGVGVGPQRPSLQWWGARRPGRLQGSSWRPLPASYTECALAEAGTTGAWH